MPRGFLRKPAGEGRFPAVMIIHGGLREMPLDSLKELAMATTPTRFVNAGYVTAVITYRSRDVDPQSGDSLEDCMAALQFIRMMPYVDSRSVIVYGCSGGGDLALEIAAAADICAIVAEEPASMLFTGMFNTGTPKKGDRYTAADAAPLMENPKALYTRPYQKRTSAKIGRIHCPILIVQGDQHPVNRFNAQILIPELKTWEKKLEVITYPGQGHCFGFQGREGSDKLFRDVDAFCKRNLPLQPRPDQK
jgi:acetyl esterase/lipase